MNLSLAEQFAHSTVRIECDLAGGGVGTGTGFFYSLDRNGDQHVPVIVTNNHVIKGAIRGRFLLTLHDGTDGPAVGKVNAFELDSFESRWLPHPDKDVDLCVMPIAPLLHQAQQTNPRFYFVTLNKDLLPTAADLNDMLGLETIVMVGYPNGLWDQTNNQPIFRKGVLASDYKHDWNGKKEFLIDAACFPGSSGSPVILFEVGSYQTRNALVMGSRIKLLGILYAVAQHTIHGDIKVVTVPTQQKPISIATIPNNLGFVIKAEQLNAFEGKLK